MSHTETLCILAKFVFVNSERPFSEVTFYEKTSSNDSDMCRTSSLCGRSRMHEHDLVVTERVGYRKFFIASSRVSNRNANRNAHSFGRSDKFDGALLL
jgi:hypothetical protein